MSSAPQQASLEKTRQWLFGTFLLAIVGTTHAQEGPYFFRGGPAYANFDASANVRLAGTEVPGGDATVSSNTGAEFEVGRQIAPEWVVALAIGIPPKARVFGGGTLGSTGKLGEATYGPSVLSLVYQPMTKSDLRPYLGIGVNYTFIFETHDGTLANLKVNNAVGEALQFGTEYRLTERVAYFVDVKKIWLKTNASGTVTTSLGPQPATARVELDPVIINTGLSFHF